MNKKYKVFLVFGKESQEFVFEDDNFSQAKGFVINVTRYFYPWDPVCGDMNDKHGRYLIKDGEKIIYASRWYIIPG